MQDNFSVPTKQSATGIIVMFVNTLQKLVRALIIPLFVVIVKSKGESLPYILAGIVTVILLIAVFSYFSYHRFTFYINETDKEFVINEGVFTRTNLTIQLDKIQQVNIRQSLLQRIIGVYSLQIDTAGSDKKEGDIKAIGKTVAEQLKLKLLSHRPETHDELSEEVTDKPETTLPFLKLSPLTLLKIGATSNYGQTIALIMAFLAAGFQSLKDLIQIFKVDQEQVTQNLRQGVTFMSICVLIVVVIIFLIVLNIIRTFIKYYDFEVFRQKYSLIVNQGLFAKKNTFLNAHRVQVTTYSQNYFQKKMNMLDMRMKQNATAASNDGQAVKSSDIEIPGCSNTERDKILKMIFDEIPEKGLQLIPNYRYVFLGIVFWIILPLSIFFGINSWFYSVLNYFPLILAYILMTGIMLYYSYRNHRLYVSKDYIIKKQGIWDVDHLIIVPHKIQAITVKQMLWHRRANIGHITCHTAAGSISFRFGDYTRAKQLMNYWLYQVESSAKDWM